MLVPRVVSVYELAGWQAVGLVLRERLDRHNVVSRVNVSVVDHGAVDSRLKVVHAPAPHPGPAPVGRVVRARADSRPGPLQVGVRATSMIDGRAGGVEHRVGPHPLAVGVQITPDVGELTPDLSQGRIHGHVTHGHDSTRVLWIVHVRQLVPIFGYILGTHLASVRHLTVGC